MAGEGWKGRMIRHREGRGGERGCGLFFLLRCTNMDLYLHAWYTSSRSVYSTYLIFTNYNTRNRIFIIHENVPMTTRFWRTTLASFGKLP